MMMCKKCMGICGVSMLVLGVLFLLVDLKVWSFWGISWWSAVLILMGVGKLASKACPDCNAMREACMGMPMKKMK